MSIQKIYGACPHDCPDTCSFITEVQNGRAVNFYANPDHPITEGWLCAKVRPYLDHVYHPDRLQYPLRRVGPKGSGQWARISWDEAMAEIGDRWRSIIDQYGAAAILPYSYSGTLGLVQMSVASGRFWQRLGASQLERSICGAAAEYAVNMTLGVRHSSPYDHVEDSQLVIIWGHNPVSTAPHFMPHLKAAQKKGCRVVVIDPRRTRTARGADLHLAPLPGTDGALALGMAHVIVAEERHNEAWLAANTIGWPQLCERLDDYPPERAAAITGLPAADIIDLARTYAASRPALIKIADGLQRNRTGGQNVRAICTLPALTGQYGLRGGGLSYSTSGYVMWDGQALLHWDECPPAARSVNMNRLGAALLGEVTDPPLMSLFVFGANPAAISPNAGKIVEGLKRDDLFTVVHELFMTDTADYADIVLPATSQLEQVDLHKPYGHTWLTYNHPAIPPLDESKSNWEVMSLLAKTMGFTEPWLHHNADDVIDEILTATAARNPALQGITLEKLKSHHTLPLTIDNNVPFADLHFRTPSGKVELYSAGMAKQGLDPLPGWRDLSDEANPPETLLQPDSQPLNLITAAAHHFVTSSLANQDHLLRREGPPFVEIHPTDAADRGIADGDIVIVENERGWCKLQAVVTDAVRPGVLASPKGRWAKFDPFQNGDGGRNVNWTVSDTLGDMAGQSTFHSNRVWVRKS
ncbi:MAG: molybdopterin oxidoreductase family protein [Anaerolineae bacterium]|nr:molybdopterin oxidoreductase family protein [Anaerolineae bacterium]